MKRSKAWFVYIISCNGGRFYTGITNNIERRFKEHKTGKGARFTRAFGAKKLLYKERHKDRSAALVREAQIKSWDKLKKKLLVCGKLKK